MSAIHEVGHEVGTIEVVIDTQSKLNVGEVRPDTMVICEKVGNYDLKEDLNLGPKGQFAARVPKPVARKRKATHRVTCVDYVCKEIRRDNYLKTMQCAIRLGAHPNIERHCDIVSDVDNIYVMCPNEYGDMHDFVKKRKRLSENECRKYFRQIIEAVSWCHDGDVILRDLKLRKIAFVDKEHTKIVLNFMEESIVLPDDAQNDIIISKQRSPAYTGPEILNCKQDEGYSGKAADMWAIGVILYIMLHGRYPFLENNIQVMFSRIREGRYVLSAGLSQPCRSLIKSLLHSEPSNRPTAQQVLEHPWFAIETVTPRPPLPMYHQVALRKTRKDLSDQVVPE